CRLKGTEHGALPSSTHPRLRRRGCRVLADRGRLWRRRRPRGCGPPPLADPRPPHPAEQRGRRGPPLPPPPPPRGAANPPPPHAPPTRTQGGRTAARGHQPPLSGGSQSLQSPAPERR